MTDTLNIGASIVLVSLTALQKYNAKGAEVVELCTDGKVKVKLNDEGTVIKVNKRNCRKISMDDTIRDTRSLSLSPSVTGGAAQNPTLIGFTTPKVQVDASEDFRDFSKLMTEVTTREKAFNEHCSQLQDDFTRQHLVYQATCTRETQQLNETNAQLQLEIQKLKARLRAKDGSEATHHTIQKKVEEELNRRMETTLEAAKRRITQQCEHDYQLKLNEEKIKWEEAKKGEWVLLQDSFAVQMQRLQVTSDKRHDEEKIMLGVKHSEELKQARLLAEKQTEVKIDAIRGEFEKLFTTKLAAVDERSGMMQQVCEQQLEAERDRFQSEKERQVQLLRNQEEQRILEIQHETAGLVQRLHEKDSEITEKTLEAKRLSEEHLAEIQHLEKMHQEKLTTTMSRIDAIHQDLAACRTENTLLKVKLQEQDIINNDVLLKAHTITTPVKPTRQTDVTADMMGAMQRDFSRIREESEREHAKVLRDQDHKHTVSYQSMQRRFEDALNTVKAERDAAHADNKVIQLMKTRSKPPTPPLSPAAGIIPDPMPSIANEPPVVVYSAMGYKGDSQNLFKGTYDINNLTVSPILSIKLPEGATARFHQNLCGSGPARTVKESCLCVTDFNSNGASLVLS
eukprot:TRINITY_DN9702_c0_g8_i1.p1 TRINITY_DN9702_c0_g8~~TRINITY_DN9702_c0_g8_i1.p1  ORF type:complete len:625 (+),score=160.08 TRINITY_DN9702_c0_g8_i1:54-1928(+)